MKSTSQDLSGSYRHETQEEFVLFASQTIVVAREISSLCLLG